MMAVSSIRRHGVVAAGIKLLRVLALILLFYLLQVAVVPHLGVFGVMPNLLMVIIAIMTVSYGKQFAFITGAVIGIILESMAVSIPLLYVVIYPVLALLCAQVFADMSDVKREMRRIKEAQRQSEAAAEIKAPYARPRFKIRLKRTSPYDLNPHLRIFLNVLMLTALYEGIMIIYVALGGVTVNFGHFQRAFAAIVYSGIASVLMFPTRALIGMYTRRFRNRKREERQSIGTDPALLRELAIVPDDAQEEKPSRLKGLFRRRPMEEAVSKAAKPEESELPPSDDDPAGKEAEK